MSPGRVHQLGQYVSGEVHNAVGQFVLGTKCLLTISSLRASEGQFLLFPVLDPQPNSFPLDFGFALKCSA